MMWAIQCLKATIWGWFIPPIYGDLEDCIVGLPTQQSTSRGLTNHGYCITIYCTKLKNTSVDGSISGWWFQTFFVFHNIWDNPSHWPLTNIFQVVNHQPV